MASGTFAYEKADPGNLNAYLGGKIMSAAKMAGEERKIRDDQIKKLSDKENRTEEEEQKLKELVGERSSRKRGAFFGKALAHEFGGDLFRRTKGTFKQDPKDSEDPALTKKQRFSALLRGEQLVKPAEEAVKPNPFKQLELFPSQEDKNSVKVEDTGMQKWVGKFFDAVQNSYNSIADKLKLSSNIEQKNIESEGNVSSIIEKIVYGFDQIKSFFDKDNNLKQQEVKIQQQELNLMLDEKDQAEMVAKENQIESGQDLSTTADYSFGDSAADDEESRKGGGILSKILDIISGEGKYRRPGAKRRLGRRKFSSFGRKTKKFGSAQRQRLSGSRLGKRFSSMRMPSFGRGGGSSRNLVKPVDQYTSPVGPLPMNSRDPWAASPSGMPGINGYSPFLGSTPKLSEGGIVLPKKQKQSTNTKIDAKLNEGGIVTNPTVTTIGQDRPTAVLPLNRNKGKSLVGKKDAGDDKSMVEPLSKALQLPTQAAGGLLLSVFSSALNNLGGISTLFKPFFNTIMSPLARVFGLPANIINSVMGGSAQAATLDSKELGKFLKSKSDGRSGRGGGGGGGGNNPPPAPTGNLLADLEADVNKSASEMEGEIMQSNAAGIVNPTQQPWCAAYVNSQLERNGIKGSGSAMADSFLNWGAPVDVNNIQPGDVIVGDYGGGSRSHVMFAVGSPKNGYVDIIGGNQSGKVTRGSIALNKIDGARRASTSNLAAPSPSQRPATPSSNNTPNTFTNNNLFSTGTPPPSTNGSNSPSNLGIYNLNLGGKTSAAPAPTNYLNASTPAFTLANPYAPMYGNSNW
jgi:uncharacterized protein (TIGR02594 family)